MKHALLTLGTLTLSVYGVAQTGSAADFQKVSSDEGGLQSELSNSGKFGHVFESQVDHIVFSGAPAAGNGEFFVIELAEDGSVLSEKRISSADFAYFEDKTDAQFGASVVDLGDANGDESPELIVGAPGIDGGKLFGLISDGEEYDLTEIFLPPDVDENASDLGEFLHYDQGAVLASSSENEGAIYRLGIDLLEGAILLDKIDVSHPLLSEKLEEGDRFGSGLSVADVNGDGIKDILCGAPGDDDQDTNFGAVYQLYRNDADEIAEVKKLSRLEGDFGGFLNVDDEFGITVRAVGDLDQNGAVDLAVGAPGDDDGGTDIGSVWILFMHPDGWVMNERKINRFEGNFTLDVGTDDHLAGRIATIGDRNGDGTVDIVASVTGDDDGGTDRGGFYTIFLEYCPAPSGDFDFEVNGPEVSFFAEGGEGYSYIWNFDDGGYSEAQNPVHTYENTGTYMVCLAINNECGGDNFCENVQVTNTLDVSENSLSEINIYPNPASESVFISGNNPNTEIRIYDITGKVVINQPQKTREIDVSELVEGLYLMEIIQEGNKTTKKIKIVR